MAEKLRYSEHGRFARGVNLSASVFSLRKGEARVARNCYRVGEDAIQKRGGNQLLYTFPFRPVGFYSHEWKDPCRGNFHVHLAVLEDGSLWKRVSKDPEAWEQLDVGSVEFDLPVRTDYASFATVAGDTYIAIGSERLRLFDGERVWWAGLEAPDAAPTVAVGAAGTLSGTFRYVYTFTYESESGKFFESGPSPISDPITATDSIRDVTFTAHAAATGDNGERCTGYRLYRTIDIGDVTTAPLSASPQDFFLVEEIPLGSSTSVTYNDDKDSLELTDRAPLEQNTPPEGTQFVIEHSKSLFCIGYRFNRLGLRYSEPGRWESFPAANESVLQTSSLSGITAVGKVAGILTATTSDAIFNVTGSNPRDFVPVEAEGMTGCVAPASMRSAGNQLIFLGKNGYYSWDGIRLRYLSEQIEPTLEPLTQVEMRVAPACVFPRLNHYMTSVAQPGGSRRVWVYDLSVLGSSTVQLSDEGESEVRATHAWFEFTGMRPTAMAVVRDYDTLDDVVLWADASRRLWQYDVGTTDDNKAFSMVYRYVFKPEENGNYHAASEGFKIRKVIVHTDELEGSFNVGVKYLRSFIPGFVRQPAHRPPEFSETDGSDTVVEWESRFAHYGSSGALIDIRHETEGAFRMLKTGHWWHGVSGGLRHLMR